MGIKKNTLFKAIRVLIVVLAITCSMNTNATPSNQNASMNSTNINALSTSLFITSSNLYALTWNWGRIKDWFSKNCRRCGRKCRGRCGKPSGGGNHGDSIPLDGGLGILMLGAAAFGIKKLRENKNDKI